MSLAAKALPNGGMLSLAELSDGEAFMAHDSLWTAFTALADLIGLRNDQSGQLPSLADVAGEWHQLRGRYKVAGASGWICLALSIAEHAAAY